MQNEENNKLGTQNVEQFPLIKVLKKETSNNVRISVTSNVKKYITKIIILKKRRLKI